jgi:dolichol-phosphate mannosyltransferase
MPIELWVQAAHHGLRVVELPVPLIYLEEARSFGGSLDDGRKRLEYYHCVLDRAMDAMRADDTADRSCDMDAPLAPQTGCKC